MKDILARKWFYIIAVVVFAAAAVITVKFMGGRQAPDQTNIAADIDGRKITNLEFQTAINRRMLRIVATEGRVSSAEKEDIMLSVFKALMNDALLEIFAKNEGVVLTPEDREKKRQRVISAINRSHPDQAQKVPIEERMKELWTTLGYQSEEELFKDLDKEVLEEKLSAHLYPEKSYTVSDSEINEYIPMIAVRQIVFTFDPYKPKGMEINFSDRKIWERAKMVYNYLTAGANFGNMAKKYSQETYAANGGYIGWINQKAVVPQYWEVVSRLKKGEISEPFETDFGILIVQCVDKKDLNDPAFDKFKTFARKLVLVKKRKADFVGWFYRQLRKLEEQDRIVIYNHVLLANKYRNMGKYDDAAAEYKKAMDSDKEGAPYYHIDVAMIYARQKRYSEAIRELRTATEIAPTDPLLFFSMGQAYMEVGEHDKALVEFRKASDMSRLNYSLHDKLEKIYTQLGLLEEADREHELYVKAIEILGGSNRKALSPGSIYERSDYEFKGVPKGGSSGPSVRDESQYNRDIYSAPSENR